MIPDPFTVAKAIDIGAKIAMKLYAFIKAVVDAPDEIRKVASGLWSLNLSLCQVQGLLLDPAFGTMHDEKDLNDLGAILQSCLQIYTELEPKVEGAYKTIQGDSKLKKLWVDVKWVFETDSFDRFMLTLDREKHNLSTLINVFTLYRITLTLL